MAKRIDFNNLPYRPTLSNSKSKTEELFNLINNMDTQEIKQFSIISSINLNVDEDSTGDNLIHKVLNSNNLLKKEFHRLNVIKFLVQNGVNPDKPNRENQTPLHLACRFQYHLIVEYLVSLGVDGNFQDNNGLTPLHYALQGKIELYQELKEPKEFIQKPKSVDFEKKESLLELKKQIWDKIKDEPFLKLLSNTIDKSIFSDVNIKKMTLELTKKIGPEGLKPDVSNDRKFIKENIDIIRNEIENIIKKKWSGFPELNDLEIHEKTETSYDISGNNLSPLKDFNIKSNIKKLATDSKNNIKALCESVKVDNFDVDSKYDKEVNELYKEFKDSNISQFRRQKNGNDINWVLLNNINNTNWNDFNISKMASNSIDFADNIIDWEQLTFMGGSRQITINQNTIAEINAIKILTNIEEKVFNILTFGIPRPIPINLVANNLNIPNADPGVEWDKVILAYNAIFNKPINVPAYLLSPPPAPGVGAPPDPNIHRRPFFEKWKKLFASKNKASVLYCMYCAYACLNLPDNLTGNINSVFCALVHTLSVNTKITNDDLNNGFKKYEIKDVITNGDPIDEKLIRIINILLNEDIPAIIDKFDQLKNIANNVIEDKTILINDIIKDIVSKIKDMPIKPFHSDFLYVVTLLNGFENVNFNYIRVSNNYINQIKNFNGENDTLARIIYILKKKQSIHYFSIINQYLTTLHSPDENNHSQSKLKESENLGLYYLGLIPRFNNGANQITIKEEKNIEEILHLSIRNHSFNPPNSLDLNINQIPFIGNYISLVNPVFLNANQKYNYFKYDPVKCRPPIEFSIKLLQERNLNYYNRILKHILTEHKYNLNKIIDDNRELSKAFTYIYPTIAVLSELLELYNSPYVGTIEKIIQELNKYNGYVLLYYFLLSPDRLVKIPKFNYYEIPPLKKSGKFLYFDNNQELNLDFDSETIIREQQPSVIYNQGISNYKTFMTNIMQNILKGKYIIKREALVFSKEQNIPPSIAPILGEFYKYNLKQIILNVFGKIDNDIINTVKKIINKIDIGNKDASYLYIIGKLTEELVKEQVSSYTKKQIYVFLERAEELNKNVDLIIKPSDYPVELNKTKFSIDELIKNKQDIFFYQFSKANININSCDPETTNFIIYPEEYATTELLKSKYVLKINYKLYENLLNNNINAFILDNNSQSAIFPVLKLHMNEIISNLKKNIDYREYSEIDIIKFLKEELNNHLNKLTNGTDNFKDWLNYFVCYQKNEILMLISANNIPMYLEDSFNVVCYITNQYISESVCKIDSSFCENFSQYLFINEQLKLKINNVYKLDEDNYISDLIDNKESDKKKLEEHLKKLSDGRTKIKLENDITKLKNEIKTLENNLNRILFTSKDLKNSKIIKRYEQLTDSVGTLTKILSKMIKLDNLKESKDLRTFEFHNMEKNNILNSLKPLHDFYNHTNKISEMYFTFGKYTENNKVLQFTKELLIFINKQFIIYPYFMAIKKILFEYFINMYPNDSPSDIIRRINYYFDTSYIKIYEEKNIIDVLYNEINQKIVENATNIFENSEKESEFTVQSVKELFDSVTNSLQIPEDSVFFKQIKEINNYFDSFTNRTILNWHVIIENTFKFNINQGRIINSIYSVVA